MQEVSAEFAAAVLGSHVSASRIVVLSRDLVELDILEGADGILTGGQVTDDLSRSQRRTLSATVANRDGTYTPDGLTGPLAPGALIRIDRAIVLPDGPEHVPIGAYVIDDPETTRETGSAIALSGADRTRLLDTAPGRPLSWSGRVADVARAIAERAGMGADDRLYALEDGGAVIPPTVQEEEQNGTAFLAKLMTDHALELWCDPWGILTMRPAPDPATAPVAFDLSPDPAGITVSTAVKLSLPYNRVVVVSEGSGWGPVRGEARDLDPTSPTYNPPDGSGPIGDRLAPIHRTSLPLSAEQCRATAARMLRDALMLSEQVRVTASPHPALEAGDVVLIDDPVTGASGRYRVNTVTIPLAPGSMTVTASRTRSAVA